MSMKGPLVAEKESGFTISGSPPSSYDLDLQSDFRKLPLRQPQGLAGLGIV